MATRQNKSAAGFTIIEALIALAVTGLLIAAVAVAFNASIINYNENEDIFKTINNARQALTRMTTDIRTAGKVFVDGETLEQCSMETCDGQFVRYQYNISDKTLYLETNGINYVLCKDVTDMKFHKTQSASNPFAKSVQISMTVESGNIQRTLCAAAVIRRNLKQ